MIETKQIDKSVIMNNRGKITNYNIDESQKMAGKKHYAYF